MFKLIQCFFKVCSIIIFGELSSFWAYFAIFSSLSASLIVLEFFGFAILLFLILDVLLADVSGDFFFCVLVLRGSCFPKGSWLGFYPGE